MSAADSRPPRNATARMLYLAAVPIGNLEDVTPRVLRLLREAKVIAAEDTRVLRRLLAALDVRVGGKIISLRAHNEAAMAEKLAAIVAPGEHAVYVADAGAPGISDPGGRLARAARRAGMTTAPAPGASALTALLSVAGAPPAGGAHFFGFPPRASRQRRDFFLSLRRLDGCVVLFESPRRIAATLAELAQALGGDRRAVLAREMTKLHEQVADADLATLAAAVAAGDIPARGEFALLVETPNERDAVVGAPQLFAALAEVLPPRRAAGLTARLTGADSAALYRAHCGAAPAKRRGE